MLLALATLCVAVSSLAEDDFTFFESKIRPVLVEHCYECHSAEGQKIKGGLRLDSKPAMLTGGDSGAVIVPGKPEESLLIKAVSYLDKDLQMPPKDKKLSDAQIADLATWVKMGAPDPRTEAPASAAVKPEQPAYDYDAARRSWAYSPPQDPAVPKTKTKSWAKSPIDQFILAKLEEKALPPAKAADKRTLIRRATFDLIGLPPTPKEIENFLADKSSSAFAKVVDRLLASPQYGERWGRHWLDVVRYTDSLDGRIVGTDQDSLDAWRYRDWVVDAFNRDLPYDQFITRQIAGDLLPPPEPDGLDTNGIIATGMYAIGNWGNGDADKEKILTDIADDAVDVTGRAFLGLTLACARCHDHKFDPIPTADYYSLAGIFFSSHIIPKLTPKGAGEALMRIPLISKAQMQSRTNREVRIAELEKQIAALSDEAIEALAKQSIPLTARYLVATGELQSPADPNLSRFAAEKGLHETVLRRWIEFLDTGYLGLLPNPLKDLSGNIGLLAWKNSRAEDTPAAIYNASDKEIVKIPARQFAIHPAPTTGVAVGWKSPVSGTVKIHGRVTDADANCGDGVAWTVAHGGKQLAGGAIANASMQSFGDETNLQMVEVAPGDVIQLTVLPKDSHGCDTTLVELEIAELGGAKRVWNVTKEAAADFLKRNPHADGFGNTDVWHFIDLANSPKSFAATNSLLTKFIAALRGKVLATPALAEEIQRSLETSADATLQEDLASVRGAFWSSLRGEEKILPAATREKFAGLKTELTGLKNNPPPPIAMTHGLQEGGTPESPHAGVHDVKVHVRGRYDRLGEVAPRKFPRVLAGDDQKPITEGSGRLQLAKWLTSPENPLTARVMVNRIWQHHFGEGIVRTPNNYGKLGIPPTHPELLDHLAHRFIQSAWSIKAMHRAIMASAAYQQSAMPEPATLKADPDNQLFGWMNRRRLDAESLRDSLLAAAGKLDLTPGGPALRDLDNNRRTLYLMTIRSDRSNFRSLFDAADPTAIVEARAVSTVAPQALFLMNHPFALAQTKALASRVGELKASDDRKKIAWLYENLYGRWPVQAEIKIGLVLLDAARKEKQPQENVWLEYCQALLCANEFVYVD